MSDLHAAERIKAEAMSIFADPPQETSQDVRDVIEWYHAQLRIELARAALAPAVPPGWKLVPVEPTPEMVSAYLDRNDAYWHDCDALPTPPGTWRTGTPSEATAASYRAMLKAAPSAKEPT